MRSPPRITAAAIGRIAPLEDIFVWAGQKRHELYLVFDVDLAERALYEAEEIPVIEPDGTSYLARWRHLSEFKASARLVPTGLAQLIDPSSN